jgi:3-deoxy-manno-octulosonate cytidylyltransferase (CMP-KDO synthetase)
MHIVIPARFASTRLPGKPLLDVAGKPLLQRVYECAQATGLGNIIVATDDARIAAAVTAFGGRVCMTSAQHQSGTDRIAEVVAQLGLDAEEVVVNLQGDEPLMPPALMVQVAETLASSSGAVMATACHPIEDYETWSNPNVVKVVCDQDGHALYFSRAPIPWPRDRMSAGQRGQAAWGLRHIGLYAYRAGFLARYTRWSPCLLEEAEALEQLRVLWHGERIAVHEAAAAPPAGVDTPEDLERVRRYFRGGDL